MPTSVKNALLHRKPNSNKGDFGRILVIGGSLGLTGAPLLTGKAAMRSGAGSVIIAIPKSLYTVVAKRTEEVMAACLSETANKSISLRAYKRIAYLCAKADVIAIGPGLSRDIAAQKLARKVISTINKPMVIDADALNALAGNLNILKKNRTLKILTPHPGEFSRMTGLTVPYIQKNREKLAKSFANNYNVVLVLKGHLTVVAQPGGKAYLNPSGSPGMATAGSGDVLTGIIAALIGQGIGDFQAAKTGVYLHGIAGDLAAKEKTQSGMIASDIIEKIPVAIKRL